MPNGIDDDEPDYRQPVVDVDAVLELTQLKDTVEGIASNVEQGLDQTTNTLTDFSYTLQFILNELRSIEYGLGMLLIIIILGIAVIVGTLRHWF
jgi:hypothetical protein